MQTWMKCRFAKLVKVNMTNTKFSILYDCSKYIHIIFHDTNNEDLVIVTLPIFVMLRHRSTLHVCGLIKVFFLIHK